MAEAGGVLVIGADGAIGAAQQQQIVQQPPHADAGLINLHQLVGQLRWSALQQRAMAQAADQRAHGRERMAQLMGGIGREANQPLDLAADRIERGGHHPAAAGRPNEGRQHDAQQQALTQPRQLSLRCCRGHRHGHIAVQMVCASPDRLPVGNAVGQRQPLAAPLRSGRWLGGPIGAEPSAGTKLVKLVVEPADVLVGIPRTLEGGGSGMPLLQQTPGLIRLGQLIRKARIEGRMKTTDIAARAGISRGLLRRIEAGDPGAGIGAVFEAAAIVGVRLFDEDAAALSRAAEAEQRLLTLMPRSIRDRRTEVRDDF